MGICARALTAQSADALFDLRSLNRRPIGLCRSLTLLGSSQLARFWTITTYQQRKKRTTPNLRITRAVAQQTWRQWCVRTDKLPVVKLSSRDINRDDQADLALER